MSEQVKTAIFKGIRDAFDRYKEWSGGDWITEQGVEGMAQVHIASAISKVRNSSASTVKLEVKFDELQDRSAAKGSGNRPKEISKSYRADLAVFDRRKKPTSVIEIKRKWMKEGCVKDLKRLAAVIKHFGSDRSGSVKDGYLVFYTNAKGSISEVNNRVKKIETEIKEGWPNRFGFAYKVLKKTWRDSSRKEDNAHAGIIVHICEQ